MDVKRVSLYPCGLFLQANYPAHYPFLYTSHGYELSSDASASTKAFSQTSEAQKLEILRKHQKVAACNEETASEESDFVEEMGNICP